MRWQWPFISGLKKLKNTTHSNKVGQKQALYRSSVSEPVAVLLAFFLLSKQLINIVLDARIKTTPFATKYAMISPFFSNSSQTISPSFNQFDPKL